MTASRRDGRRVIDYSTAKLPADSMTHAIQGLLGRRFSGIRRRDIGKWFFATPAEHLDKMLNLGVKRGQFLMKQQVFKNGKQQAPIYYDADASRGRDQ